MPTPSERQLIAHHAYAMALGIHPNLPAEVVDSLPVHLRSLVWNIECLANAAPGAVTIENIAPGFGLLICKTQNWAPATLPSDCPAIASEQFDVLRLLLGKVAQAILPDADEQAYQHFETDDGLICALYRLGQEKVIFAAVGIEPTRVSNIILGGSASVH